MTLNQTPAQIAAGLKLRLKEISEQDPGFTLLVVESDADAAILGQFLADNVRIIPTLGKGNVLGVRELMKNERDSNHIVYLIDCDNQHGGTLLGQNDVVVSVNYDLESDLVWQLDALETYATTVLMADFGHVGTARRYAAELRNQAGKAAAALGVILASARELKFPLRIIDPHNGQKRRIRIHDLPQFSLWVQESAPSIDLLTELAARLSWTELQVSQIEEHMQQRAGKKCRIHALSKCNSCTIRSYASGHEQFSWMLEDLKGRAAGKLNPPAIDLVLRGVSDKAALHRWVVYQRLAAWQAATGLGLVR